jgi:hypothetical protein
MNKKTIEIYEKVIADGKANGDFADDDAFFYGNFIPNAKKIWGDAIKTALLSFFVTRTVAPKPIFGGINKDRIFIKIFDNGAVESTVKITRDEIESAKIKLKKKNALGTFGIKESKEKIMINFTPWAGAKDNLESTLLTYNNDR